MTKRIKILALDTASYNTGWAIYHNGKITDSGTLTLKGNGETNTEKTNERLRQLFTKLDTLISKHKITQLVAEDIFNDKDPRKKRAFKVLGFCRGVLESLGELYQLPPTKYLDPLIAKREIWGYNRGLRLHRKLSSEQQKERMIKAVEGLGYQLKTNRNGKKSEDQADAIGILITYLKQKHLPVIHPNQNKEH